MYYYVYRITNKKSNKHYYGKRQSKKSPKDDLGIKYFSSSNDTNFIKDQKLRPRDYKYKVVSVYNTNEQALKKEIKLHIKFNVDVNPSFYNRSIQTSDRWSTTGKVIVKDASGTALCVPRNHPDYLSGKLVGINTGRRWSKKDREKMSETRRGQNNGRGILVNIYDYYTDQLLAEQTLVSIWCKGRNYNQAHLAKTVYADRSLPHRSKAKKELKANPHHHKGVYAVRCVDAFIEHPID